MATMMMTPPMDGTPFFSTPKGSMLASRCVSVICFLFKSLIKYSPKMAEISKANITAISDRNDTYPMIRAPDTSHCSKCLNK